MTPQHFSEVLEVICMTTGRSKREISRLIGVNHMTIYNWENKSFPERIQPYVLHQLKNILQEGKNVNRGKVINR